MAAMLASPVAATKVGKFSSPRSQMRARRLHVIMSGKPDNVYVSGASVEEGIKEVVPAMTWTQRRDERLRKWEAEQPLHAAYSRFNQNAPIKPLQKRTRMTKETAGQHNLFSGAFSTTTERRFEKHNANTHALAVTTALPSSVSAPLSASISASPSSSLPPAAAVSSSPLPLAFVFLCFVLFSFSSLVRKTVYKLVAGAISGVIEMLSRVVECLRDREETASGYSPIQASASTIEGANVTNTNADLQYQHAKKVQAPIQIQDLYHQNNWRVCGRSDQQGETLKVGDHSITEEAKEWIQNADVILHDSTAPSMLLALGKSGCKFVQLDEEKLSHETQTWSTLNRLHGMYRGQQCVDIFSNPF